MRDPYNFEAFIRSVEDLDRREMIEEAQVEGDRVHALSYGVPGAVQAREMRSTEYIKRIGHFVFWIGQRVKPSGVSPEDWSLYERVTEKLVEKKQLDPSLLELW